MMSCQVSGCRFSHTHTTASHRCGRCRQRGHGRIECGNSYRIAKLNDLPMAQLQASHWCTVVGCADPWSHMDSAHLCDSCAINSNAPNCRCSSSTSKSILRCPTCRSETSVTFIFTEDAKCVICLDDKKTKMVLFEACAHANVCRQCAELL